MALSLDTVHELRTAGSNLNGGGFVWVPIITSSLQWNPSGSGTNEYYLQASGGGDPSIAACNDLYLDNRHNKATQGTVGSLAADEWDYGDNDALGYSVPYVRLPDGTDPDTKGYGHIGYGKSGGVDYSQQAAAEYSAADFSSDGAGTQITTAGPLPADIQGNLFYVSNAGVGGIVGWREIISRDSGTQFTVDASVGAGATGMTGAIGGARALPTDAAWEANEPGHWNYMKNDGDYNLTATINVAKDGTAQNYITIEGYNTTRGDEPTGTDRPLIAAGANAFALDNFWKIKHIDYTTTEAAGMRLDQDGRHNNVTGFNSSGSANRYAFSTSAADTIYVNCEGISTNGIAFEANGSTFVACNAHDSNEGFETGTSSRNRLSFCIIDTCNEGIETGFSSDHGEIINCTFYNCTTAIFSSSNAANAWTIKNSIFKDNITALDWSGGKAGGVYVDYCNFHGNTKNVIDVKLGNNNFYLDPEFTDAPNGDFSIGDNMKGIGFPGLFAGGLSTGSIDLGAIQSFGASAEKTTITVN